MAKQDATVLLVDDDAAICQVLSALLMQAGIQAVDARTGEQALTVLENRAIDAIVTDLRMPGMDGMTLLGRVVRDWPEVPVIMLTAHGNVPLAVEAMKRGAADFMLKPFDREEVLFVIEKALAVAMQRGDKTPEARDEQGALVGESSPMCEVRRLIRRAASGDATVLIRGETGTGKELVARAIHAESARRAGPFVKLHCAAFPEALLESELFGYEKGAFTGAVGRKPGRVELGAGGTLFLDEIGDVPLTTQVKLLRLLQDREFERLGGTQTLRADLRFLAATHRDLELMLDRGEFRSDLFYRLNVVPLGVPPLRQRAVDIEALVRHFAARALRSVSQSEVRFEASAIEVLARQPWPGNVRQLENLVERLIVLGDGPTIGSTDVERELGREFAQGHAERSPGSAEIAEPGVLGEQRRKAERDAIVQALARTGDNRALAARILGVSRSTLYKKLSELGVA
jgi:two-component system, NtrC family, response regulator AtoC